MAPQSTPGARLKQARLSMAARLGHEVTKREIAERVGVSDVTVGRWEGNQYEPDLAMIERLAKVLGVSPGWLAFGIPSELPPEGGVTPPNAGKKRA